MSRKLTKQEEEKLTERYGFIPTKEEVLRRIQESHKRMYESLMEAWQAAPDDPEIKKELMEALKRAVNLKGEIERVFKEDLTNKGSSSRAKKSG